MGEQRIGSQLQQIPLTGGVPPHGVVLHFEMLGDRAHGEPVQPPLIEDLQRGQDDLVSCLATTV